jgi:hypothetical protein
MVFSPILSGTLLQIIFSVLLYQSACRLFHTAVFEYCETAVRSFLGLSAAYDTADHVAVLHHLEVKLDFNSAGFRLN